MVLSQKWYLSNYKSSPGITTEMCGFFKWWLSLFFWILVNVLTSWYSCCQKLFLNLNTIINTFWFTDFRITWCIPRWLDNKNLGLESSSSLNSRSDPSKNLKFHWHSVPTKSQGLRLRALIFLQFIILSKIQLPLLTLLIINK